MEHEPTHSSDNATLRDPDEGRALRWSTVARWLKTPSARRGLIAIGGGVAALAWPGVTTVALIGVIAVALILAGISDLGTAVRQHRAVGEWFRSIAMIIAGGGLLLLNSAGSGGWPSPLV